MYWKIKISFSHDGPAYLLCIAQQKIEKEDINCRDRKTKVIGLFGENHFGINRNLIDGRPPIAKLKKNIVSLYWCSISIICATLCCSFINLSFSQLKQALMETSDLAQLARTQEARIDKLDNEVGRIKYEEQQLRTMVAEQRTHISKLAKEVSV